MPGLILIRHSQVEQGALGPDMDWPLSREGRDLCLTLAEAIQPFQPNLLVSSRMRRANETAKLVAAHLGVAWRTAEGLEEHRRAFLPSDRPPGESFEETMTRFFASPAQLVFGQETADEARDRFGAAIDALIATEPESNVGIVSHGTVLALYAAPFFNLQPIDLWRRIGWPSFMVIDLTAGAGLHLQESIASE